MPDSRYRYGGMSGPDLQEELKLRAQAISIVFITAPRDEAVRRHVLATRAVECIRKPFSDAALRTAIDAALQTDEGVGS